MTSKTESTTDTTMPAQRTRRTRKPANVLPVPRASIQSVVESMGELGINVNLASRQASKQEAATRAEEIKALGTVTTVATGQRGLLIAESVLAQDWNTASMPKDANDKQKAEAYYASIIDTSVKMTASARKEFIPVVWGAGLLAFGEVADSPDDKQPATRALLVMATGVTAMQVGRDLAELKLIKGKPEEITNGNGGTDPTEPTDPSDPPNGTFKNLKVPADKYEDARAMLQMAGILPKE